MTESTRFFWILCKTVTSSDSSLILEETLRHKILLSGPVFSGFSFYFLVFINNVLKLLLLLVLLYTRRLNFPPCCQKNAFFSQSQHEKEWNDCNGWLAGCFSWRVVCCCFYFFFSFAFVFVACLYQASIFACCFMSFAILKLSYFAPGNKFYGLEKFYNKNKRRKKEVYSRYTYSLYKKCLHKHYCWFQQFLATNMPQYTLRATATSNNIFIPTNIETKQQQLWLLLNTIVSCTRCQTTANKQTNQQTNKTAN